MLRVNRFTAATAAAAASATATATATTAAAAAPHGRCARSEKADPA